jgi:hypothetical protein
MLKKYQKVRKSFVSTKLWILEKSSWVAGNTSQVLEKISDFMDIGATTGGSVYSAQTAAVDLTHAVEDYGCGDYPCMVLDGIALCCDVGATAVSFLPKNKVSGFAFAGCTATSKFARTVRNKCKKTKLLGC